MKYHEIPRLFLTFVLYESILGDQMSRRGEMTGGFLDVKRSRLELYSAVQQMHAQKVQFEVFFFFF